VGPEAVEALSVPMFREAVSLDQQRVGDIIVAYGVGAVLRLAPLVNDERWFVQMNGVTLLSRIAAPEAVPLLQPLLRKGDPRLTPKVVSALAGINDPAAARAIHTVLRTATGDLRRAVIGALLQERDPRVVPILERILHESEPFGRDHAIVLETMDALATLAGDRAVPPIVTLIRRRRWLARRKNRALKRTGVNLLLRVGSPAASRALDEGRTHGDRLLRRIIRDAQRSGDIRS
jgi:HEAT repeat protein